MREEERRRSERRPGAAEGAAARGVDVPERHPANRDHAHALPLSGRRARGSGSGSSLLDDGPARDGDGRATLRRNRDALPRDAVRGTTRLRRSHCGFPRGVFATFSRIVRRSRRIPRLHVPTPPRAGRPDRPASSRPLLHTGHASPLSRRSDGWRQDRSGGRTADRTCGASPKRRAPRFRKAPPAFATAHRRDRR